MFAPLPTNGNRALTPRGHTDSEISADSNYDPSSETLAERLYSLRDMIPPTTRGFIAGQVSAAASAARSAAYYGGRALWILSTSALLVGVPFALAYAEEQNVLAMEQEMKMRELGGELLTAGGGGPGQDGDRMAQLQAQLAKEAAAGGGGGQGGVKPAGL